MLPRACSSEISSGPPSTCPEFAGARRRRRRPVQQFQPRSDVETSPRMSFSSMTPPNADRNSILSYCDTPVFCSPMPRWTLIAQRSVHGACELHQHAVSRGLSDAAAMFGDGGIDEGFSERLVSACLLRRGPSGGYNQRHLPPVQLVWHGSFGLSQLLSKKFSRQQQTNNGGGYHGGSANLLPGKTEVIMGDVSHRYGDHYGRRRTH
jgi:hypothetical protein